MKSEHELIEDYIDYMGDRDIFEMLDIETQVLWKTQTKDTLSFVLFALRERIKEGVYILFNGIDKMLNDLRKRLKRGAE